MNTGFLWRFCATRLQVCKSGCKVRIARGCDDSGRVVRLTRGNIGRLIGPSDPKKSSRIWTYKGRILYLRGGATR
jgi:hypothetical protein